MKLRVQEFLALEYFARLTDGHPAPLPLIIRSKNRSIDHIIPMIRSIHLKKVLVGRKMQVRNDLIVDLDAHTHEFAICP